MTYRQMMDQLAADKVMLPLMLGKPTHPELVAQLRKETPHSIFQGAYSPESAMCGVWLHYGCWNDAHQLVDDSAMPEGIYWHAIVHRVEPDAGNSNYWFRQLGRHAIFPALRDSAARLAEARPEAGFHPGAEWRPASFVQFCEESRQQPGSATELLAREIQMAEWWLLFEYCARHGF